MQIANYWPVSAWPANYWPDWPPQVVEVDGLAVAAGFGSAVVGRGVVDIGPDGLAVALGLGEAAVTVGVVDIGPDGYELALAYGTAVVYQPGVVQDIGPDGYELALALGDITVTRRPAADVPLYVVDYDGRTWRVPADNRIYEVDD